MQYTFTYRAMCFMLALILCAGLCGCEIVLPEDTLPSQTQPNETAQPATEPAVTTQPTVGTEPVRTWDAHSGIRDDWTFNAGTLFIGDSLTYGLVAQYLQVYDDAIGDAKYMATVGAPLSSYFSEKYRLGNFKDSVYSSGLKGKTYYQVAEEAGDALTAVYIMLGTNYTGSESAEAYIEVVDHLLEHCPRATVYLQTIPYATTSAVHEEEINGYIQEAYNHYVEQGSQRVYLIDTYAAISSNLRSDGVHLNADGYDAWYNAIIAFAYNNNIPE